MRLRPQDGLQLLAAGDPGGKFGLCRRGRRGGEGTNGAPKFREHLGVDPIGFGAAAGAAGEVANLARIDDGDGDLSCLQGQDNGALPTAGGFADDVARRLE